MAEVLASLEAIMERLEKNDDNSLLEVRQKSGTIMIQGFLDIRSATLLNAEVRQVLKGFGGPALDRRSCDIRIPQVRLGDVTTPEERRIIADATGIEVMMFHVVPNRIYLNPESKVDHPEWNSDFVKAADCRNMKGHIEPRYGKDDTTTIDAVARYVASFWESGRGIVVHTGAGISQSAGIATFRDGCSDSRVTIETAMPTYTHYALTALNKLGKVDYLVSQNVDGLHRRAGIPADSLSELHGNAYIEKCECCTPAMEFVRPYDVSKHGRGRRCPRGGGPLYDNIINFGNELPEHILRIAKERSDAAPLNLCIGCSLQVSPACYVPFGIEHDYEHDEIGECVGRALKKEGTGPVAIVGRGCTPFDEEALKRGGVVLRADADVFMERLMKLVGSAFPENSAEVLEVLSSRVRQRDQAVVDNGNDVPYDGGADGGVIPPEML